MPICGNPECGKEIPHDRTHCDQTCFDRDYEPRRLAHKQPLLDLPGDVWDQILGAIPPPQVGFGGAHYRNDTIRLCAGLTYWMQGQTEGDELE